MSHPNPLYDRRRRRRRRHGPSASHHSPLTTLATAAAVAYGAYRLGSWAWVAYFGDDDDDEDDDGGNKDGNSDEEEGDIPREWTEDYRSAVRRDVRREEGFSSPESDDDDDETEDGGGDDDGVHLRRSRRSRVDWNAGRERSRRPSPAEGHRHHSPMKHEDDDEGSGGEGEGGAAAGGLATGGAKEAAMGLGGAVSAGMTAGIRAYNEKNSNYPDAESVLEDQERRLRMGRCRLEASRAMTDFLPTLKRAIAKETDVSGETEGLKRLRTEKRGIAEMREKNAEYAGGVKEETDRIDREEDEIRERERRLWNDIKTKSVTRLVATVYAHTIVFLVLTVQVNLLGGRLLREEREEGESNGGRSANPTTTASGADRYRTSHQTVLARTYKYLFSRGIPLLAETAGAAVDEILRDWDVLEDDATLRDVSSWMESVRYHMEHHDRKDEGTSPLVKFIIPPEGETEDAATDAADPGGDGPDSCTPPDELAGYILDETYDLLESPAFADAERRCLDVTFGQLRTNVLGRMFLLEDDVPLATVVTHFQKTAVTTFHRPPSHEEEMRGWGGVLGMMEEPLPSSVPNEYVSRLERLDAVLELSDVCF